MQVVMPNGDVIQYVVDGQNRRIARKVNGRITNKWLYAGQLTPVAELDSANNVIERFSGGFLEKNDSVYQIITDQLGSPRLVVNVATGVVVQRINYDEFGDVTYDSNPGFQPFGFAGGFYDPETKLVRFGARDCDAAIGRWISKDPMGFGGGVSNLYEYCVNDPINGFDVSGLQQISPADWNQLIGELGKGFESSSSALGAFKTAMYTNYRSLNWVLGNSLTKWYRVTQGGNQYKMGMARAAANAEKVGRAARAFGWLSMGVSAYQFAKATECHNRGGQAQALGDMFVGGVSMALGETPFGPALSAGYWFGNASGLAGWLGPKLAPLSQPIYDWAFANRH